MKTSSRLLTLFVVLTVCIAAQLLESRSLADANPIVGAFGIQLGSVFQPGASDSTTRGRDIAADNPGEGSLIYKVSPPDPNPLFDYYEVIVSSHTHKISEIQASYIFSGNSRGDTQTAFRKLADLLKAKYNLSPEVGGGDNPNAESLIFESGNRKIRLVFFRIWSEYTSSIEIHYIDNDLYKTVQDEFTADVTARHQITDKGL
jgi:hypothetical protein